MKTLNGGLILNVQNQYKDIAQDNKIETNTMLQMTYTLTTSVESKKGKIIFHKVFVVLFWDA